MDAYLVDIYSNKVNEPHFSLFYHSSIYVYISSNKSLSHAT